MPGRWAQGAQDVEALLRDGHLERVAPSADNAARLLGEARTHLASAQVLTDIDPVGAYDMLYSAARKAITSVLAQQGLRATARGGHRAVQEAISAQLGRSGAVVRPFGRMRRTRNDADYPKADSTPVTPADVADDLAKAAAIVQSMESMLAHVGPFAPEILGRGSSPKRDVP